MDISLKLKEKESVLRFKNGSPKLKDVLRKKCKERLKKNRNDFVDRLRNLEGDVDVKNELTNMLKEDLKTVYTTINNNILYDDDPLSVEEQVVDEELQWLMTKYDMIFDNEECLMEMYESLNEVICPICQKSALVKNSLENLVECRQCHCSIYSQSDLLQIKENIMSCLDEHNKNCNVDPQFNLLNELGECHIYLICYSCSSFAMLV